MPYAQTPPPVQLMVAPARLKRILISARTVLLNTADQKQVNAILSELERPCRIT
jgi:hypothetical protein